MRAFSVQPALQFRDTAQLQVQLKDSFQLCGFLSVDALPGQTVKRVPALSERQYWLDSLGYKPAFSPPENRLGILCPQSGAWSCRLISRTIALRLLELFELFEHR
jgi:hypothetical protein